MNVLRSKETVHCFILGLSERPYKKYICTSFVQKKQYTALSLVSQNDRTKNIYARPSYKRNSTQYTAWYLKGETKATYEKYFDKKTCMYKNKTHYSVLYMKTKITVQSLYIKNDLKWLQRLKQKKHTGVTFSNY